MVMVHPVSKIDQIRDDKDKNKKQKVFYRLDDFEVVYDIKFGHECQDYDGIEYYDSCE